MPTRLAICLLIALSCTAVEEPLDSWPNWRGPAGSGAAPANRPPVTWSERDHLRWRTALPGSGYGSPVVWEELIFVVAAVPTEPLPDERREAMKADLPEWRRERTRLATHVNEYVCLAVSRADGSVVWRTVLVESAPGRHVHADAGWASCSPVTDGEHVFAFFGSHGLFCLDLTGEPVWDLDLGDLDVRADFGEGASPALHGDRLVVNWDHEGESFIVCLDKHTGQELWRRPRDEVTSWSTPTIVEHAGVVQVIVAAAGRSRGYRLNDGEVLWECGGMTKNVIATPAVVDGRVYVASGFRGSALQCLDLDRAAGDITGGDAVLWTADRHTPYAPSPLVYGGILYNLVRNDGLLSARDAVSGELCYGPEQLAGIDTVYASPVGAGDHIYVLGREGTCVVLAHGPALRVEATNRLDDRFTASPAVVGDELILRGHRHLYCLAEDD